MESETVCGHVGGSSDGKITATCTLPTGHDGNHGGMGCEWSDQEGVLSQLRRLCVGNPLDEVKAEAKRTGWIIRVMDEDGQNYLGTCDVVSNRINVSVTKGIVTAVSGVG